MGRAYCLALEVLEANHKETRSVSQEGITANEKQSWARRCQTSRGGTEETEPGMGRKLKPMKSCQVGGASS